MSGWPRAWPGQTCGVLSRWSSVSHTSHPNRPPRKRAAAFHVQGLGACGPFILMTRASRHDSACRLGRECQLSASAAPDKSSPPRRFGGFQRPKAAFPLGPGQELAGPTLRCDTRCVGVPTSLAITLRKEQSVGHHREQPPVAQGTRVGLRLHALRRAHVPPAHSITHSSSLEPAQPLGPRSPGPR
jgi:hypothetical protein